MHQMQEHFNVMNRIVAARLSACLEKRKGSITEEDAVNHRKYSLAIGDELRKLNERNNNDNAEDDLMMRRFDKSIPAVITAKPPNGLVKTAVDAIAAAQLPLSTPLSVITAAPPASSAPVVVMAAGTQAPTLLQPYITSSLVAAGNSAMPFQAAAAVLNVSDAPTIANNLALAVPTVVPASEATSAKVEAVIKEQKVDLDYSVRVPMVAEHAKKVTDGGCLNEKERTKDDMTKMDLTQAALSPKQIGGNASSEASETTHVGEETKTVKTLETVARQALNSIPAATVTPMATLTNTTPSDGRIAQSGSVEAVDELWKRSAALPTTPLKSAAAPIIVAPAAPVVAGNGPISNNSYRNSSQDNNNSAKMVTTTTKNRVHNTNSNSGRRGQQQQQQQQAISLMNAMNLSQNMDLSQQQQNMIMHQNQAQNQILMVTAAAPPTYHHPQQQQQHGGGGGHAQAHVSHQHHQQQLQQMIQQQHASANAPQPMPVHVSQVRFAISFSDNLSSCLLLLHYGMK
ncbi:unnamed protein product [Anisakis simplex]|uniref:SAM domain-containing protein n=1 Tax=Anisakis simplex TaxID=6269 RepID=A0A0M3J750_ANISI|nr:unnamed protein product [Anisakis simplex]